MEFNREKLVFVILAVIGVICTIVNWIFLPDIVVAQIAVVGQPSTLSKPFALFLPAALCLGGAGVGMSDRIDRTNAFKPLILSVLGIVVMVFSFVVNVIVK